MLGGRKRRLWICSIALILNLAFIWGNSLLPGDLSGAISQFVRKVLSIFFPADPEVGVENSDGVLRKIAHVLEFCSLGFLMAWLLRLLLKNPWLALPGGMLAGAIDEMLQLITPNRGPHIRDVGIDTLGVVAGIGVFTILLALRKRKKLNLEENKS